MNAIQIKHKLWLPIIVLFSGFIFYSCSEREDIQPEIEQQESSITFDDFDNPGPHHGPSCGIKGNASICATTSSSVVLTAKINGISNLRYQWSIVSGAIRLQGSTTNRSVTVRPLSNFRPNSRAVVRLIAKVGNTIICNDTFTIIGKDNLDKTVIINGANNFCPLNNGNQKICVRADNNAVSYRYKLLGSNGQERFIFNSTEPCRYISFALLQVGANKLVIDAIDECGLRSESDIISLFRPTQAQCARESHCNGFDCD